MAKVFLHIGTHKTGTSAIQRMLSQSNNVFYPKTLRLQGQKGEFRYAHHGLAIAISKKYSRQRGLKRNPAMWDQVSREIESSGHPIAVISSELLWPCTDEEILYLTRSLSQHETKAIIFFREPFSYAVSSYKQRAKMNYRYSLRTHIQEQTWRSG